MTRSPDESARTPASSTGGNASTAKDIPLLIDAKAAAVMLAIGSRTLWTLTKCQAIPSRQIGRSVRYCPEELRAWVVCGCPTDPGSAQKLVRS